MSIIRFPERLLWDFRESMYSVPIVPFWSKFRILVQVPDDTAAVAVDVFRHM